MMNFMGEIGNTSHNLRNPDFCTQKKMRLSEKLINHKDHKENTKDTELLHIYFSILCEFS